MFAATAKSVLRKGIGETELSKTTQLFLPALSFGFPYRYHCGTHMFERSTEYLVGELSAGSGGPGGQVSHVLQDGREDHAGLLGQLLLTQQGPAQFQLFIGQ